MFSCWISLAQRSRTSGVRTLEFVLLMARGLISLLSITASVRYFPLSLSLWGGYLCGGGQCHRCFNVSVSLCFSKIWRLLSALRYFDVDSVSRDRLVQLFVYAEETPARLPKFGIHVWPLMPPGVWNNIFTNKLPLQSCWNGISRMFAVGQVRKYSRDNATTCQDSDLCPYSTSAI